MNPLLEKIKQLLWGHAAPQVSEVGNESMDIEIQSADEWSAADLDEQAVKKLIEVLESTHEGELSCEETFNLLDQYVELNISGKDAALLMPLVKKHLEVCGHCCANHDILWKILQSEQPA